MYSKAKLYNLAANHLLLTTNIVNPDTDTGNVVKVFNQNFDTAFWMTLQDLDLDSTATQKDLELKMVNPNNLWCFAYKYPSNCAFFRRIQSCTVTDNRYTHIQKHVRMIGADKVILTNEENAIAEFIPSDISISALSAAAGLCVSLNLAKLSASLQTGKGARSLIDQIQTKYIMAKAQAQEQDVNENVMFVDESLESELVAVRTT